MPFHLLRRAVMPGSSLAKTLQIPSKPLVPVNSAYRTYASSSDPNYASAEQTSNVSSPKAGSAEGQRVNQTRATESRSSPDTASVQSPVSNPEESGIGQQEEQTASQEHMKRDPSEPDARKREEVLKHGQNKKLDPADN